MKRALAVGLVYELHDTYPPRPGDPPDAHVEYELETTVAALEGALRRLGHRAHRLGSPLALLARAGGAEVPPKLDAALSIAEGRGTRNREAWGPVLLEMLEIPQLGSDALTLSLTLDKAWTRAVVAEAGVPVAPGLVLGSAAEAEAATLPAFPLFVKPRWEGTAKGIGPFSRVEGRDALAAAVERVTACYRQPALVERFLPGPEYTVTLIGNDPPRALPVLQRALEAASGIGLHAVEPHPAPAPEGWSHRLPGRLEPGLEKELAALATRAWSALACHDFARADFKLDEAGRPCFLEMNPLPTFAPEGSFGILAELLGVEHEALLAEVLEGGLRRLGLS